MSIQIIKVECEFGETLVTFTVDKGQQHYLASAQKFAPSYDWVVSTYLIHEDGYPEPVQLDTEASEQLLKQLELAQKQN